MSTTITIRHSAPSLFIIGTPFQALCAIEAMHEFNITDYKILLGLINTPRNEQLFYLLEQYHLAYEIVSIDYIITKKDRLKAFIPRLNKYRNIFIGDVNNELYQFMAFRYGANRSHIIYLDDGAGTISFLIGERKMDKKFSYYYNLLSYWRQIKYNKTFFTLYWDIDSPGHQLVPNLFKYISSQSTKNDDRRNIYIAGTVTNGFYVASNNYLFYVESILRELKSSHPKQSIIYIPHGRDVYDGWDTLCARYNVEVVRPKVSIELYLMSLQYQPKEIYGFTSSALFNLKKIFPKSEVYNILFPNENIPDNYILISDYYLKHGINKLLRK